MTKSGWVVMTKSGWSVMASSLALGTALAGCGGGSANSSSTGTQTTDGATAPPGNYLPLAVGMSWTYNVTSTSGASGPGTIVVEAAENAPMSGQPALRVHTTLLDGGTLAWDQTSGTSVIKYEEQQLSQTGTEVVDKQYMPSILVLDESAAHLVAGVTWIESYQQLKTPSTKGKATKEEATWIVQSVDDSVTVPAGTYSCIRVSREHTTTSNPSPTVEWYAIGVGKVKETGAGQNNDQTLELASTAMMP
jgi:hypothetical protein